MGSARRIVGLGVPSLWLSTLALAACTAEEPRGWTRVVEIGAEETTYYSFVHADREADVCISVTLHPPSPYAEEDDDGVVVRGANFVVGTAWGREYTPSCTNAYLMDGPSTASGTIELDDFVNGLEPDAPCTVSFDLTIEGMDGHSYEMSARDFPILDAGCPRPGVYSGDYDELDAAWGEHNGRGNLVVSAWDPEREVCVWARFLDGSGLPASEVEAPGGWVYTGLRFGLSEPEACVASNFVVPPTGTEYLTDSASALGSSGSVSFGETGPEGLPCTLDLDLDLQSEGRYDWTPDDVHMRATGVSVSGACE